MAACNRNCIHRQENRELVLRRQIEICVKDCFDNYLLHNMGASRYPMAERLAASGFPVKCETRSWRSISVVLSEELRRPWRRSPKIIQIVELVQLQRNCPDWEGSQSPVPECDEVARRYGKEIAVVEPVKGGALMNLPEEAGLAVPS
ncbi:MAG: hypothetical protein ACLRNW_09645 [Neglectibacter sp.]